MICKSCFLYFNDGISKCPYCGEPVLQVKVETLANTAVSESMKYVPGETSTHIEKSRYGGTVSDVIHSSDLEGTKKSDNYDNIGSANAYVAPSSETETGFGPFFTHEESGENVYDAEAIASSAEPDTETGFGPFFANEESVQNCESKTTAERINEPNTETGFGPFFSGDTSKAQSISATDTDVFSNRTADKKENVSTYVTPRKIKTEEERDYENFRRPMAVLLGIFSAIIYFVSALFLMFRTNGIAKIGSLCVPVGGLALSVYAIHATVKKKKNAGTAVCLAWAAVAIMFFLRILLVRVSLIALPLAFASVVLLIVNVTHYKKNKGTIRQENETKSSIQEEASKTLPVTDTVNETNTGFGPFFTSEAAGVNNASFASGLNSPNTARNGVPSENGSHDNVIHTDNASINNKRSDYIILGALGLVSLYVYAFVGIREFIMMRRWGVGGGILSIIYIAFLWMPLIGLGLYCFSVWSSVKDSRHARKAILASCILLAITSLFYSAQGGPGLTFLSAIASVIILVINVIRKKK